MRKICYLASLAIVMFFAACSSDNDELGQGNKQNVTYEDITVGVNMPGDNTRIDFNGDITQMVWAEGDQLKVIGRDANGSIIGETNIDIQPNFSELNATFKGSVVSADNYEFAYLGKGDAQGSEGVSYTYDYFNDCYNVNCNYDSQIQASLNDFNHIKQHMFLNSARILKTDLKAGAKVSLNHNTSVFRLNVLDMPEDIKTAEDFRINLYVNYVEGTSKPIATTNLFVYGGIKAGTANYIYLAFDPQGHAATAGQTLAVKFESLGYASFGGEKPVLASCIAKATSTGKTYQAGGIYKANVSTTGAGLVWEKKQETTEKDPFVDDKTPELKLYDFTTKDLTNYWGFKSEDTRKTAIYPGDFFYFDDNEPGMYMQTPYSGTIYGVSEIIKLKGTPRTGQTKPETGVNKIIMKFKYVGFTSSQIYVCAREIRNGRAQSWKTLTAFKSKAGASDVDNTIELPLTGTLYGKDVQIGFKINDPNPPYPNTHKWYIKKLSVRGEDAKPVAQ